MEDVRSVTYPELLKLRRVRIENRLAELQAAVADAEAVLQSAEAAEPQAAAAVTEAGRAMDQQIEKTRQLLIAAGAGVDAEVAATNPQAAQNAFEYRIRETSHCKAAAAAVADSKAALRSARTATQSARADFEATQNRLQGFVNHLLDVG
jgi:chromosome segregation ATPase